MSNYQYWNGSAFTSTRLIDPVFNGQYDPSSVLQGVSVGSIFYNAYYKKYIVLSAPGGNQVVAYAASSPQGPYSAPVQIWSNSTIGGLYTPIGLPARDTSGKTLIVDLSQYGPDSIQVVLKLVSPLNVGNASGSLTLVVTVVLSVSEAAHCFLPSAQLA